MSHGTPNPTATAVSDRKQQTPPSPSLSISGDYHHYCHVFVVKSEAMSTEVYFFLLLMIGYIQCFVFRLC
jgi:hypothetical protein